MGLMTLEIMTVEDGGNDGDEGYSRHTIQPKIENMKEEEDGARTERKRESDRRREDHRIGRKRDRSGVQEDGATEMDGVQTRAVITNCVKPLKEKEEILRTKPKMDKGGVIRSERLVEGAMGDRAAEKPIEQAAGRSGGVYVPPFKLAEMMTDVKDKSSADYQRMTWDALRKSINALVNKANTSNIKNILPELFGENLIRGRGLFARSCIKSQMASPGFTHVFAALVAVLNTKFPELGELLLKRIILQLRRAFKRNDKVCPLTLVHRVSRKICL
jgi:pre-mRNA-splicing factor CWC22